MEWEGLRVKRLMGSWVTVAEDVDAMVGRGSKLRRQCQRTLSHKHRKQR